MNTKHVELWERIEQFQLDSPEAILPFSARLARENNWTPGYARRVIAEYRRFAFLAVAAGHPVSPSEDIDQAWHLHLTYSENYWKVFCPEILGKPLHHQPTQGGEVEKNKFEDWYARTLESYERFFGEAPPSDIWPGAEIRRNEKHSFIRVDRQRNWVISKPRLKLNWKYAAVLSLTGISILCGGAMFASGANVFDWRGPDFLLFYILLVTACFTLGLVLRRSLRLPAAPERLEVPELDGYATAFLNGGKRLAVNTAIANLVRQKAMRIDARRGRATSLIPKPAFSHQLEQVVYAAADSTDGNRIANVRASTAPILIGIADALKSQGLVVPDAEARRAVLTPLMLAFVAIAMGGIKILIGVSRDKPVGFLSALCIVSVVFALLAFARRPLRSRHGDAVLKQLRQRHIGSRHLGSGAAGLPSAEFATVMGLFGMTALAGSEWNGLRRSLQPVSSGNGCSSSGCGNSCGGSCGGGCGGGCGGCGGGS